MDASDKQALSKAAKLAAIDSEIERIEAEINASGIGVPVPGFIKKVAGTVKRAVVKSDIGAIQTKFETDVINVVKGYFETCGVSFEYTLSEFKPEILTSMSNIINDIKATTAADTPVMAGTVRVGLSTFYIFLYSGGMVGTTTVKCSVVVHDKHSISLVNMYNESVLVWKAIADTHFDSIISLLVGKFIMEGEPRLKVSLPS